MISGLYESLVTRLIQSKLETLNRDSFFVKEIPIDKSEATHYLATHLFETIKKALNTFSGEDTIEKQILICNKIVEFLKDELNEENFKEDLIDTEANILRAVFKKVDSEFADLDLHLSQITPSTKLTHSALFTGGGNNNISLESEIRKEIKSADEIDLLVSFIKWKGVVILLNELRDFVKRGGVLRVITTTYMGATDVKAIQELSKLQNTTVKVSYNTGNERLHAKAYLFKRNTGYHTGYIGSSNFSRSALTDGLEWNLKITTKEVGHIILQFQKTFNSYWEDREFEVYKEEYFEKLSSVLNSNKTGNLQDTLVPLFDITPYSYQKEILEKLRTEREVHGRYRNLLVAATGTGKTIVSSFDFKEFKRKNPNAKLLFIAHREEILKQAIGTFRGVLKDNNFGNLWVGNFSPSKYSQLFASVQTLTNKIEEISLSPDYYDFIIIDEVHHIAASSYRPILNYFKPKILLGLTATPERSNEKENILDDFCNKIGAEIRLPQALNKKLLCPFQYFGISTDEDLTKISWRNGKYLPSELSQLYTSNNNQVRNVINNLEKYTKDINHVCALGFCVTIEHAKFMSEKFNEAGLKSEYLTSSNTKDRDQLKSNLLNKEINYLFVVDIFNEGVDIPQIDTVLFLRPTESLTVFLQQLGRGLRLAEGKDSLTVLDFVGNARPEYNFDNKFRALIGKTTKSVLSEVEDDFPHLPLGCSIILEENVKSTILENIKSATSPRKNQLLNRIKNFQFQTDLKLTLLNFIEFTELPLEILYKKGSWNRLLVEANILKDFKEDSEEIIRKAVLLKWCSTVSKSYFDFILRLCDSKFIFDYSLFNSNEKKMLLMLYYDIWNSNSDFTSLTEAFQSLSKDEHMISEIYEVITILSDRISFIESSINLPFKQPLKLHSRYTKDQIMTAFELSTFTKKHSNREGVAENKDLNTELLFIDLIKSEESFSPTTMYDDYALSETLFHWQSQNGTRNDLGKGLTYINHKKDNKNILLFVREKAKNEFNNRNGYVFIGKGDLKKHYGSKPMNIEWELQEPIPAYLWTESSKMKVV